MGATGKLAENTGEKRVAFRTAAGGDRRCTFHCADVNNMLACVAGLADGSGPGTGNLILFFTRGCIITPEAETHLILPNRRSKVTDFERKGNVYVMGFGVDVGIAAGKDSVLIAPFSRAGTSVMSIEHLLTQAVRPRQFDLADG